MDPHLGSETPPVLPPLLVGGEPTAPELLPLVPVSALFRVLFVAPGAPLGLGVVHVRPCEDVAASAGHEHLRVRPAREDLVVAQPRLAQRHHHRPPRLFDRRVGVEQRFLVRAEHREGPRRSEVPEWRERKSQDDVL